MRISKKTLFLLALTAAVAGTSGMAFAKGKNRTQEPPAVTEPAPTTQPGSSQYDDNAVYKSLTPRQKIQYDTIIRTTEEAMLPLREQMLAKRLELQTMASMPNMDHEAIARVAASIAAIHTDMIRVHDMMADRLATELGISVRRGTCSDGYTECDMHRSGMSSRHPMQCPKESLPFKENEMPHKRHDMSPNSTPHHSPSPESMQQDMQGLMPIAPLS